MGSRGFTLVELIIAVTVVMILAVALNFSFQGWMSGYNIESEIKQIQTDLMYARARAIERARFHFVTLPSATTYTIYEDDSNGVTKVPDGDTQLQPGTGATADTQLAPFPKTVSYPMTWGGGTITFDKKGYINALTVPITSNAPGIIIVSSAGYTPDYNCILLTNTKINIGKMNGTNCVVK